MLCFLLTLISFATDMAPAAPPRPRVSREVSGRLVVDIAVEGLKRIEKEAVLSKVGDRKGKPADASVSEDIRALHRLGYFDEIEVLTEDAPGGVRLVYRFVERPVISEIDFDGNEQLSDSDLSEVTKLKVWSILDANKVREDAEAIEKHYADKGYYLAKVGYEIEESGKDQVKVRYRIKDFEKIEIRKITFLNNRRFSDAELKGVLRETREGGLFSFLSGAGTFKESALKQDLQILTYFYLEHGYVKFRFENPVVTVSEDKKYVSISIYVDEGEVFSIGKIDFSGDLLFPKEELQSELHLKSGDAFKISTRNLDLQRLTEKYQDLGYAFVNTIPKMEIHDDTQTVDVDYMFEKGDICTFGEINVLGNTKTYDEVIRREFRVVEGERFHGTQLRVSRERVERLGFFAPGEVTVNTVPRRGTTNVVDVEVRVKERSTGTITLGAGYGTGGGFFLNAQIQEINLFGRGQAVSLQGVYAADNLAKSLSLGFTDPYAFGTQWSLGAELFYVVFPIPDKYSLRRTGFNLRAGYPISDDINLFVTYKFEAMRVETKADPAVDSSLDEGLLSGIVWSLIRDKRNNRFETTGGNYQSIVIETSGIGFDKYFVKWNLNNRVYWNFAGDFVLRNSTEFGHIFPTTSRGTPPSERFYLGGPNNLRGFFYYKVGPTQTVGSRVEPMGGTVQFFNLFEIEHPLIREAGLKWVAFFDMGNAFSNFPIFGTPLRMDYGVGFRWFSPIGPLRFEWGFPIDPQAGESSQFVFFIGTPF